MAHIFFELGASTDLSLAEIESVFGTEVEIFSDFAFTSIPQQTLKKRFPELGGVMRAGRVMGEGADMNDIISQVEEYIEKKAVEGKKMRLGFHFANSNGWKKWGIDMQKQIKAFAKDKGISVRIANRGPQSLDSYAIHKEKLTEEGHSEFVFIPLSNGWGWGKTLNAQEAYEYARRDTKKPVRDMQVGMLPPKLARMMINFARNEDGVLPSKIYDPFCGTGTVLLEGMALGLKVAGSDMSKRMVEATTQNALWYYNVLESNNEKFREFNNDKDPLFLNDIFQKDAQKSFYPDQKKKVNGSTIVAEGFLGKIFQKPATLEQYETQKETLFPLYRQFLFQVTGENIDKMVFGFPFWRGEKTTYSFVPELIAFAEKMGWKQEKKTLKYLRDNQNVGREIVILKK